MKAIRRIGYRKFASEVRSELPDTPPLGEFGDVESRSFDPNADSEETPQWLRDLQSDEPPKPAEPEESESDWMSRLHQILPQPTAKPGQSTTFYSDEELAAMAAAEKYAQPEYSESTDNTLTQPVDVTFERPSDVTLNSSDTSKNAEAEADFINALNGVERTDLTVPVTIEPEQPSELDQREELLTEPEPWKPENESIGAPEDSVPWMQAKTAAEPAKEPDLVEPPPVVEGDLTPTIQPPDDLAQGIPETEKSDDIWEPDITEEPKSKPNKNLFLGLFARKETHEDEEPVEDKPEKLIPEGVLQPQYNRSVEYSGRLEISDRQRASISLLKGMLVGEIQPQTPPPANSKVSGNVLRMIIGLILLAAMLYPLITGTTFFGQQALFSPGVVSMHNAVSNLPENTAFLVVTDYEPAFTGEMKAASTGVIDHLMMKGLNFSIISTVPSGPALSHDLINSVRPAPFGYQPEKIAYLGYLPGGTTGLRDFIRNPREAMPLLEDGRYAWTYPASQSVFSMQDYAGILIITENTETGRAWIEQLHGSLTGKPVLMVVSAQSAPLMRPYLDSKQVTGLIGGRVEGAMYDRIMESPPRSVSVMASYQVGMVLAAGLILLGGLYGLLQGLINRRSHSSTEDLHVG